MSTDTHDAGQRQVRPWVAALLTVLGLGVGFYYARQSKAAWRMVLFSIVLSVAFAVGVAAYIALTDIVPDDFVAGWPSPVDWIGWGITLMIAMWAWRATARHPRVERAGPLRLLGYLAVWLVPIIVSLIIAMGLRVAVVQPFRIPSGAMQPTLQVGDYVAVTKNSYGYSRYSAAPLETLLPAGRLFSHLPQRGDLAVFRPAPEPDRDFVKRVIGLPGDRVQMVNGELRINGAPVQRESLGIVDFANEDGDIEHIQAYRETLPGGVNYTTFDRNPGSELDNTRVYVVPAGHYFLLGDDRDNSADSRVPSVVGYVPFDNFIGRVDYLKRGGAPAVRMH